MSKKHDDDEPQATAPESAPPAKPEAAPRRQPGQIEVSDSKAIASYANFCRVTGTPEELIVDFGLNKNMNPEPNEPIEISQRLIVNFFTAKRLLAALHMAVQRHEAAFGVLETDVQKRVVPAARAAAAR
ncbi:MAG: DUF3467 domain-containing protein [Planctomycetia bacterium]